jgi:hypothetical protein
MASLVVPGHFHSASLQLRPLLPPRRRSKGYGGQARPPTFPRPIPAHLLPVRRSAIQLPDRLPFDCSVLVDADSHLDDERIGGT